MANSEHSSASFARDGFAILAGLGAHAAADYQKRIYDLAQVVDPAASHKWGGPGALAECPDLWPLVTDPGLLAEVRRILGADRLCFAEHSDLKVWIKQPASGWHRDSGVDRVMPAKIWPHDYRVVRVAYYLQSEDEAFKWGALPGSHRFEHELSPLFRSFWRRLQSKPEICIGSRLQHLDAVDGRPLIHVRERPHPWHAPVESVWIATLPTRVVVFDPRLIHAGGPVEGTKVAAFFALGADDRNTWAHADTFGRGECALQEDFARHLKSAGIAWPRSLDP
jgi:hypothetical protein